MKEKNQSKKTVLEMRRVSWLIYKNIKIIIINVVYMLREIIEHVKLNI